VAKGEASVEVVKNEVVVAAKVSMGFVLKVSKVSVRKVVVLEDRSLFVKV
jgi:chorismate-pyruvate lyase